MKVAEVEKKSVLKLCFFVFIFFPGNDDWDKKSLPYIVHRLLVKCCEQVIDVQQSEMKEYRVKIKNFAQVFKFKNNCHTWSHVTKSV